MLASIQDTDKGGNRRREPSETECLCVEEKGGR